MSKPAQILELERACGVELKQRTKLHWNSKAYRLNSRDEVAGLSLYRCGLENIEVLSDLGGLKELHLARNNFSDLSALSGLLQLSHLDLRDNQLSDLSALRGLLRLVSLDLRENELKDLSHLSGLVRLEFLYLTHNQISDIDWVSNLRQLVQLHLAHNQLINISALAGSKSLRRIDLRYNQIASVPAELLGLRLRWRARSYGRGSLMLSGNPLQDPPPEVIEEGREAIELYYRESKGDKQELREAKLILLGEPDAGKSSIVRRLLYNEFDPSSASTLGTDIHRWSFDADDGQVCKVNIWDFGGQDIQQSIHHLFLTREALYLIVLDARRDESALPWLQTINAFASGSTVLVAVNQLDINKHPRLNEQELRATYPNIAGFFYTSCKYDNDHGLSRLFTELQQSLQQLPSVSAPYPQKWFNVKQRLEQEQQAGRHYMSMPAYHSLCCDYGMAEADSETFLSILDRVGTVRWFRNFEYFDYQVFDPSWLTVGLYHILMDSDIKDRGGEVDRAQIQAILLSIGSDAGYSYTREDVAFFIEAIQYYKFAFKVEHSDGSSYYRVPKGFKPNPPSRVNFASYQGENYRQYVVEFKSFAPSWILHRLLVSLARGVPDDPASGIFDELYWFYGFVYHSSEGEALVQLFEHERKLFISVPKDAPNLYPLLRCFLIMAFADSMELEMQEWLLFGAGNQSKASLRQLRRYAESGKDIYEDNDTLEQARVSKLLSLFPENVANVDSESVLVALKQLKGERQEDSKRIEELATLVRELREQASARDQVHTASKIKQKLDWLHSIAQSSESAQKILHGLQSLVNWFSL